MGILFFLISLVASTLGAISGIGGGVIIKPVLDAANVLPVATISFLSSCTVLTMSIVSLFRQKGTGVKLDTKRTTPLAIGAAIGGVFGKYLFDLAKKQLDENLLGGTQALILLIMTIAVLVFVMLKSKIKMHDMSNLIAASFVGLFLGLISAFLGIGGGPMNIAVLYFFFSMSPKAAALNSIYVIMFSQITSLASSLITRSIPEFSISTLLLMIAGGVFGALLGGFFSKKMEHSKVEACFKILLLVIIAINIYNMLRFF